ncbi:MAG: DUF2961 domain-containing protein, partial [Bacteroidales bacterium]|nr:DUF2961 domain-containing protein [Bacteroidales bacterium]
LRQNILSIYFDNAATPQVHAPLGDFFGAAPGLNPFHSLPFTVSPDTTMVCRFLMPYRNSARIEIRNLSKEAVVISSEISTREWRWIEGETMYFRAAWKMAHDLTAYNTDGKVYDMNYLDIQGAGRLVGAATFLYNPSPVPTSWGNWWGEGDEKIFVDSDTFPSFFGTGSEDYYNYSWSSAEIFFHSYCAQPRNDGPGNRGYVSNLRCHIADDILFGKSLNFNMELRHHGVVPGVSYGSIAYFYALPSANYVAAEIDSDDIRDIRYSGWTPLAYLGCAGYMFLQAEDLAMENSSAKVEEDGFAAGGKILKWRPGGGSNELTLVIQSERPDHESRIGLTLAHSPTGAIVSFSFNGEKLKFDDKDSLITFMSSRTVLDNHFSSKILLKKGNNKLILKSEDGAPGSETGIDFIWLRNP